jgi:thioredoxin reductase (NADPH)
MEMKDTVIIGAGPAGLTAAIYLLRAGINKICVIEKNMCGGQIAIAGKIENYPGILSVSGGELATKIYNHAKNLNCQFIFDEVVSVDFSEKIKKIYTKNNNFESKTVIIANGLSHKKLNCPGEAAFFGKGVSYCATCDGMLFKNKKVIVVGSGNTAVESAFYLSKICENVIIVIRKDKFSGEEYQAKLLLKEKNVFVLKQSRVVQIIGGNTVEAAVIESGDGSVKKIPVPGIFVAIGHETNNNIYKKYINTDNLGYFTANESCVTNIEGVFVAGDCRFKPLRQIITAASDGAAASKQVLEYLKTF